MLLQFSKFQGTGNDFIILDNRDDRYKLTHDEIRHLCDRRFGIGADGLMMLGVADGYDFSMAYYNADGNEGSMCGNGGRCLVAFANMVGIHKNTYRFIAIDGPHEAEMDLEGRVRLRMKDVDSVKQVNDHFELDTGSPHYVKFIDEVRAFEVTREGRAIRSSKEFLEHGINVNFVQHVNDHTIFVRTYERGVEAETLSCGTGVTASALMAAHNDAGFNQVDVVTLGGKLSVEFDRFGDQEFRNIWLAGPATFVFSGEITSNQTAGTP